MENGLPIIRKKKQEWCLSKASYSHSLSVLSAFELLPEFSQSILKTGGGKHPQKGNKCNVLFVIQKLYKICLYSYTVSRKSYSPTTEL